MSDKSKIEWTEATWNPVTGCSKVSQGCKNCYALRDWARLSAPRTPPNIYTGRAFTDVQCHPERLDQPLRWSKPRRIFVNSMSDLFHEDVPDEFIDKVFALMGTCKWHVFQILTKRPQRALAWFSERWQPAPESTQRAIHAKAEKLSGQSLPFILDTRGEDRFDQVFNALDDLPFCTDPDDERLYTEDERSNLMAGGWPLPNVWFGVSVEDQATADERIPLLLQTPAAVRWISAEPLLGPIDLGEWMCPKYNACQMGNASPERIVELVKASAREFGWTGIDWIVAGGESGPDARVSHPNWFRTLRDQCQAAGVPFFFKQWGEYADLTNDSNGSEKLKASTVDWIIASDGTILGAGYRDGKTSKGMVDPNWEALGGAWMGRIGKKKAGRILDGRTWDEFPHGSAL